jgi:REP element-mobilizing transposase RayT
MDLPVRKTLPHDMPSWVADGADYFVTICTQVRGKNQLCSPDVADRIRAGFSAYQQAERWHAHLVLLMPDHLHAIISFSREPGIKKSVSAWKQYLARASGIRWQRDFFEHRLRSTEEFFEKASYIRQNPVRAGLVSSAEDWLYVWDAKDLGRAACS